MAIVGATVLTGAGQKIEGGVVVVTDGRNARDEFRDWCMAHQKTTATAIVDSIATDHPSDAQLVSLAKQYFKKFDAMAADPTQA